MTYTYRFFIGSNNETKELEQEKALSIIQSKLDGFTFYEAQGCWKGTLERSLIVEAIQPEHAQESMQELAKTLAHELEQDAVALDIIPSSMAFIS